MSRHTPLPGVLWCNGYLELMIKCTEISKRQAKSKNERGHVIIFNLQCLVFKQVTQKKVILVPGEECRIIIWCKSRNSNIERRNVDCLKWTQLTWYEWEKPFFPCWQNMDVWTGSCTGAKVSYCLIRDITKPTSVCLLFIRNNIFVSIRQLIHGSNPNISSMNGLLLTVLFAGII